MDNNWWMIFPPLEAVCKSRTICLWHLRHCDDRCRIMRSTMLFYRPLLLWRGGSSTPRENTAESIFHHGWCFLLEIQASANSFHQGLLPVWERGIRTLTYQFPAIGFSFDYFPECFPVRVLFFSRFYWLCPPKYNLLSFFESTISTPHSNTRIHGLPFVFGVLVLQMSDKLSNQQIQHFNSVQVVYRSKFKNVRQNSFDAKPPEVARSGTRDGGTNLIPPFPLRWETPGSGCNLNLAYTQGRSDTPLTGDFIESGGG